VVVCPNKKNCFSESSVDRKLTGFVSSYPNSKKHAGRIREDPVGFVVQTAAFYQGTVRLFVEIPHEERARDQDEQDEWARPGPFFYFFVGSGNTCET
jgi:hypothetical protein